MRSRRVVSDGSAWFGFTVFAAAVASACGDSPPTGPDAPDDPPGATAASLTVTTATLGRIPDPDGYTLLLDGAPVAELAPAGTRTVTDLPPGDAVVSLAGVDHFCRVQGAARLPVDLVAGRTTALSFDLLCDPLRSEWLPGYESITAEGLRQRVFDLAADSTLGRHTFDPVIEGVAAYLAEAFADAGLQPSGPDGLVRPWTGDKGGSGPNVLGWIPGSDPDLRDETILFVAHFDHLGYRLGLEPDGIFNGADDNASGTAAVVQLAEAFGRLDPPPARSVVFLAVSGEELGLLGSRAYADDPAFPLARTRAVLNFDMIGSGTTGTVGIFQLPDSEYAPLAATLAERLSLGVRVVRQVGLVSSDGLAFSGRVPEVLDFHTGLHDRYHTPDDEAERLDYAHMERIVRLAFLLGLEMATWTGGDGS